MDYRLLGRTGVQVSPLCFGCMSFGGDADEATSAKMFARCREAGINFFDTADAYNGGRSEQILGRLMQGMRDELVITSKVHGKVGPGVNDQGLSRRHIMLGIEQSLKRLGTDRLDIYFVHMLDPKTPMDQTLRALDDLVRQGKVLYPAVSNWSAWQIAKAMGISQHQQLARFECIQPMYNLAKRQVEVEILPMAMSEKVGVISYSPLGGGLLTGKYASARKPQTGRLIENKSYVKRYADPEYFGIAERFTEHARQRGHHPATLAVAWVMSHPAITAPIIGARNLEQLEPSLKALEVAMTLQWRAEITALSIDPPLATDRAEEKPG
jgi:aryl-alcohol dehydrogenase-like predicted oxidoreductase